LEETFTLVDLFAGAGGMTLGFEREGFSPQLAVELDAAAGRTYAENFGSHVLAVPIQEVERFPKADVVIGGPPCQGFSPLGRDRDPKSRELLNRLWREYARALRQTRPLAFVIENVPEFVRSEQFEAFMRTARRDRVLSHYKIEYRVLNAAEYGVPQRRRRGIVIASRLGTPTWPEPTHGAEATLLGLRPFVTVRDAIGDLPLEPDGINWHIGRNPRPTSVERYRAVPEGGNRFDLAKNRPDLLPECWRRKKTGTTDVFGRLWWDRPAFTIRTEFFKPEKGRYLHPKADRPLTHREAARLQSFPDDFVFGGSKIEVARQIGNAVPPLLAQAIARAVRSLLDRSSADAANAS
jgi:DNA (cytosine-5)-methyltransferase 1